MSGQQTKHSLNLLIQVSFLGIKQPQEQQNYGGIHFFFTHLLSGASRFSSILIPNAHLSFGVERIRREARAVARREGRTRTAEFFDVSGPIWAVQPAGSSKDMFVLKTSLDCCWFFFFLQREGDLGLG